MTNTDDRRGLIAAFIAERAPEPLYAAACAFCGKKSHAKMCEAQRTAMGSKRTDRYTMDAQDLYDGDRPLRDTDIMDRLNEQDDDLTRLRADLDAALKDNAGLLAFLRELDYADPARADWLLGQAREMEHPGRELMARTLQDVVNTNIQIEHARHHIGALLEQLPDYLAGEGLFAAASAARAWLRRA